jgi:hypothetical protein
MILGNDTYKLYDPRKYVGFLEVMALHDYHVLFTSTQMGYGAKDRIEKNGSKLYTIDRYYPAWLQWYIFSDAFGPLCQAR